jgi:hypothetical protein
MTFSLVMWRLSMIAWSLLTNASSRFEPMIARTVAAWMAS